MSRERVSQRVWVAIMNAVIKLVVSTRLSKADPQSKRAQNLQITSIGAHTTVFDSKKIPW